MTKRLSQGVSVLFHPLFMPLLGILIIFLYTHLGLMPGEAKMAVLRIVVLSTILMPLAPLPVLYYQKRISSLTLSKRAERLIPLFLTSGFFYFGYYILYKIGAPNLIQHFMFASFVALLMASFIHIFYKISLHMVGLGGLIGLISWLNFQYQLNLSSVIMVLIFIAGLTGSARLYLDEHENHEIYVGFLLGFITVFGVITLMNNL